MTYFARTSAHPCWCNRKGAKEPPHPSGEACYLATWDRPPLPWVKRLHRPYPSGRMPHIKGTWHLAIGIRKATGDVQVECNVGSGPGPFAWREVPVLDWRREPGEWWCRRCIAKWTEELKNVTVRTDPIRVTKGQLSKLAEAIEGTDLMQVELRPVAVDDQPAIMVSYTVPGTGRQDHVNKRVLVIGSEVVKL